MTEITTTYAIKNFGYKRSTLNYHLRVTKRLPGRKVGRDWVFQQENLHLISKLPMGRPVKTLF